MRGIRAVVVAAALVASAPGSGLAQERGSGTARPDKRVEDKKPAKKKPSKKVAPAGAAEASPRTTAPATGEVEFEVQSAPRGATITVDGVSFGTAPVTVRARSGRRVVAAKLAGHVDAATTIEVAAGLGYIVFSLARETDDGGDRVADKTAPAPSGKASGFGTGGIAHPEAMQKARASLKKEDYAAALRYAEAALASKAQDREAAMIATIAACGVGDAPAAKKHLPRERGSYREISITRCGRLGVGLP